MERVATTAERLRAIMQRENLKQVDIVNKSGLPKGAIALYVSGKVNPKQDAVNKMALALGVDALWLMGYDVPMTAEANPKAMQNQVIADVALRMQDDELFMEAVDMIGKLEIDRLSALVTMLRSMN